MQQYTEINSHKQIASVLDLFTVDELKLLLSTAANGDADLRSFIFKQAEGYVVIVVWC